MDLKGVDFLISFKCTSRCRHCCYKSGIDRKGRMRLSDAQSYLRILSENYSLEEINVLGGEPFLFFDLTNDIIDFARENAISRRGVITNGYWAQEEYVAYDLLRQLKKAGLNQITFSIDAFHQEHIPLSSVRNGLLAAKKAGFEKVWVDSYYLKNIDSDNTFDITTKDLINNIKDIEGIVINTYPVRFWGRACDLQDHFKDKKKVPENQCPLPFWLGKSLDEPSAVEIDDQGNVTLCPGISIGNTNIKGLEDIIDGYDCSSHPILSRIRDNGPSGLLELAEGFKLDKGFVDQCHLCYELRRFLHKDYPEYLSPPGCY